MKKYLFLLLTAASASASAGPYVGLEYGSTKTNTDHSTIFPAGETGSNSYNAQSLSPNDSTDNFVGIIGYRVDNLGLELSYKKFDFNDSKSQLLSSNITQEVERESEVDLDAKQFVIKPVFFYPINEQVQLKAGLGLTYTKYKFSSSAYTETDNDTTDTESFTDHYYGGSENKDVWGAVVSFGAEYMVTPKIGLGASASYQKDSEADSTAFMLSSAYYF